MALLAARLVHLLVARLTMQSLEEEPERGLGSKSFQSPPLVTGSQYHGTSGECELVGRLFGQLT